MKILQTASFSNRKIADLLVVPFCEGDKEAKLLTSEKEFLKLDPIIFHDFKGKLKETSLVYSDHLEKRIMLLGLGKEKEITDERLRIAASSMIRKAQRFKVKSVNFVFPKKLRGKNTLKSLLEGMYLTNYHFDKLKKDTLKDAKELVKSITIIGYSKTEAQLIKKLGLIAEGVFFTRDLVMHNADEITPQKLASIAKEIGKEHKSVKVEVFDKKRIKKEKMGLLLAVNQGSKDDPAFIIMEYNGSKSKKKIALIGKGITYDTGGLSLKPSTAMDTMKTDMAGAAAVLGTVYTAALLKLKVNFVALIPATENSIGSGSYKPGDVQPSYLGKTVEVVNTDAEGRLIMADALAYANAKYKPAKMIDIATLTGAIAIALGSEVGGLFSNDRALSKELQAVSKTTGEHIWQLPLYEGYRKLLLSEIADLKNCGDRTAGSITAALFLKEFVGDTPWAHIDIGGTAFHSKAKGYYPAPATGYGVRLLIEFLENEF